jgi:hypothetical protein
MASRHIKKMDLSSQGNDLEFWMTQTSADRLAALRLLRDRYGRLKRMDIQPDFKDLIALLNQYEVIYLVVGGFAVAHHGYPRFTGDIDFWVKTDPENSDRVVKALREFGFAGPDISSEDFLRPNHVVQLGYPPNRIDLLTGVTGLDFDECWQSRDTIEFEDVTIHFLSLEHLKLNKRLVARKKDEIDLENLP